MYETRVEEEVECKTCGRQFSAEVIYRESDFSREKGLPPTRVAPSECPTCKTEREECERREHEEVLRKAKENLRDGWFGDSGIYDVGSPLSNRTFEDFEVERQPLAYKVVREFAENFGPDEDDRYPSLVLYSHPSDDSDGYGLGKTHLVIAAVQHIIRSWDISDYAVKDSYRKGGYVRVYPGRRCPVLFVKAPKLMQRFRTSVRQNYNRYKYRNEYEDEDGDEEIETEDSIYEELSQPELLILDDVGKERPTDYIQEVYYNIVDERCSSGQGIIITSNLPLEGDPSLEQRMGKAAVDRLIGMSRGRIVELKGQSYRRLKKQP